MNQVQLLKFGFVVFLDGEATYDHVVRAKLPYADELLSKLHSNEYPAIASRFYAAHEEGVSSPIFRFVSSKSGIESFQSAYYLADALTRKGMLPVYLPGSGEVKDLMPLLNEEQKADAQSVIAILRARYIKPSLRSPASAFMVRKDPVENMAFDTVELSDAEMLAIFGRLPHENQENVVPLLKNEVKTEDQSFIDDQVAQRA